MANKKAQARVDDVLYDVKVISYVEETNEFELEAKWLEKPENVYLNNMNRIKRKRKKPENVQSINEIINDTIEFKKKLYRGSKIYQCPFCMTKGPPGRKHNMSVHINGIERKD
ncbi:uncharacterized protein LOC128393792 [Panonychus citri]|uniref:uncharacterized protein LOC128393792 n=1 Tax=Panonychus citri TaxID=50023 RepID=UPI0023072BBF|nr:uncharacterized protein LOC128393792 [Panonychus citri]